MIARGTSRRAHPAPARGGFSLIELLVIVAVLSLLMSILAPSLTRARATAREVICKLNLRNFGNAFLAFAAEHQNRLPGSWSGSAWTGPEPWQWSWLAHNDGGGIYVNAPQTGTIYPYMGGGAQSYRCPSLPVGVVGSGVGSNGRWDYSMFMGLAGAKLKSVPLRADYDGTSYATPLLTEEDPAYYLNFTALDGGHSNVDQMGAWHDDGGNYVSVDGSVHRLSMGPSGPVALVWTGLTPTGQTLTLSWGGHAWGKWE